MGSLGAHARLGLAPQPEEDDELAPPAGTPVLVLPEDHLAYWIRPADTLVPEHGIVERTWADWHGPIHPRILTAAELRVASEAAEILRTWTSTGTGVGLC